MYNLAQIVLILCTSAFTLTAAVIDYRTQRIPNKLTLPMFAAGWVYQLAFYQLMGLGDGLAGFAIGFGMFFLLWIIGGGGGGDAKLVGAVSVWLGFYQTLALIVVSTLMVVIGTGVLMLYGMLTRGVYRTKRDFLPPQADAKKKKSPMELLQFNRGRKGMTYGLSVAIATVLVVTLNPIVQTARAQRLADAAAKEAAVQQQAADEQKSADQAEVDANPKSDGNSKADAQPAQKVDVEPAETSTSKSVEQ